MRRNKNIHKGKLILTSDFMDWLQGEAAVGGKVVSIEEDSFDFEIEDEIVSVNGDESQLTGMAVTIEDKQVFDKIHATIEVGQTLRTGSGQWTFYTEPEEIRYIISDSLIKDSHLA